MKYFASCEENTFKKVSKNPPSTLRKKREVNSFYLRKSIHTLFFLILDLYGTNKMDTCDDLRKESTALIGCAKETVLNKF